MLRVSRWEDDFGYSEGYWLVRGLPVCVARHIDNSWGFIDPEELLDLEPGLYEFVDQAEVSWLELERNCPSVHKRFKTRAQALMALESELQGEPDSALSEVL